MVPIHVVTGFLGAGKTTLVLDQITRREGRERCAVVVNDFGTAQFDKSLLEGKALVKDIPGGCVCCTAPENLAPSVMALLEEGDIDRIFIEATGLARPADIIDTLRRQVKGDIEITPVIVVLDPEQLLQKPTPRVMIEQLQGGDILIVNHIDQASEEAKLAVEGMLRGMYPPFMAHLEVTRGVIPEGVFEVGPKPGTWDGIFAREPEREEGDDSELTHIHVEDSTLGFAVSSFCAAPEEVFDMGALRALFKATTVERIKGIFHTDIGWYRLEVAGGRFDRAPTQARSATRVDVILFGTSPEAQAIIAEIAKCHYVPPEPGGEDVLRMVVEGETTTFNREALMALPHQVEDVSKIVEGRKGEGVMLKALFEAQGVKEGQFVVVARDGMVTEPAFVDLIRETVLVHSLGGEPLPGKKGGPFRIFVPEEPGISTCGNVKKVDRISMVEF